MTLRAKRLGSVFDNGDVSLRCDIHQGTEVGTLTEEVYGHNGLRSACDLFCRLLNVDVESARIDVYKYGCKSQQRDHFGGSHIREHGENRSEERRVGKEGGSRGGA